MPDGIYDVAISIQGTAPLSLLRGSFNHIFYTILMDSSAATVSRNFMIPSRLASSVFAHTKLRLNRVSIAGHYQAANGNEKFFFIALLHERSGSARDFIVRKRKLIKLEAFFMILPSSSLIFYIFIASSFSSALSRCTWSGTIIISHFSSQSHSHLYFFFFVFPLKSN